MIIRTPTRRRYVILAKTALEDRNLSLKSKGLWSYLMSRPDDWTVLVAHLVGIGPDGRVAVTAALAELERAGYVKRETGAGRHRDDNGTWDATTTEVYETPRSQPVHKTDTGQSPRSQPVSVIHRGSSTADNRHLQNNETRNDERTPLTPHGVGGRQGTRASGTSPRQLAAALVVEDDQRVQDAVLEAKVASFPGWPLVQVANDEESVREIAAQGFPGDPERQARAVETWRARQAAS